MLRDRPVFVGYVPDRGKLRRSQKLSKLPCEFKIRIVQFYPSTSSGNGKVSSVEARLVQFNPSTGSGSGIGGSFAEAWLVVLNA